MNRFVLLTIFCLAVSSMAALVPGPSTRLRLSRHSAAHADRLSRDDSGDDENAPAPYIPLILLVNDDATVDSLTAMDVIIYHRRDDMLLASIPRDSLERVLDLEGLVDAAASGETSACLDIARPFGAVPAVQAGSGLPSAYDGEGVVVGFTDVGFDPHHVAFRGRVAALSAYDTPQGKVRRATTPAEIGRWITDDSLEYHATHVANIMAGGYMGSPYYGVATGTEIVGTTSRLHDVGILSGVEDIISYARAAGKRAVVNMSLSSPCGPHDGTSLLCRYLESCARDAVICISAGNHGASNCFATKVLTPGDDQASVTVSDTRTWTAFQVSGYVDIWGGESPLEFRVQVYDSDIGEVVYSSDWITGEDSLLVSDEEDAEWARYMGGYVYAEAGFSGLNGRYNVAVLCNTASEHISGRGQWARYQTCLNVRSPQDVREAARVDFYADISNVYLGNVPGSGTVVSARGSINEMCTARGVVSVGMACSRNEVPLLSGGTYSWKDAVDHVSRNSSYSDVDGIARLPLLSGPGEYLISAASGPYVACHPEARLSAVSAVDGEDYYWIAAGGTSMSSPFVAGVAALWLQADPSLTADDIIDIACSTARRDFPDISDPRWGAGCIDAAAGMREIIRRAGLSEPVALSRIYVGAGRCLVVEGADPADVALYSVTGQKTDSRSSLAPGVYVAVCRGMGAVRLVVR